MAVHNRIRVGVLFGGRSGEHEVSIVSATSIMKALDPAKYEIIPIGITKTGQWSPCASRGMKQCGPGLYCTGPTPDDRPGECKPTHWP